MSDVMKATPGPWRVHFNECGFSSRYYVVRGYYSKTEHLRSDAPGWRNGMICDFATEQGARAAIAKANGGA